VEQTWEEAQAEVTRLQAEGVPFPEAGRRLGGGQLSPPRATPPPPLKERNIEERALTGRTTRPRTLRAPHHGGGGVPRGAPGKPKGAGLCLRPRTGRRHGARVSPGLRRRAAEALPGVPWLVGGVGCRSGAGRLARTGVVPGTAGDPGSMGGSGHLPGGAHRARHARRPRSQVPDAGRGAQATVWPGPGEEPQ